LSFCICKEMYQRSIITLSTSTKEIPQFRGCAFIQEQFSTSSSLEGQRMVPAIHTLCTHSKNEATDVPCNDSNQTLHYTALNTCEDSTAVTTSYHCMTTQQNDIQTLRSIAFRLPVCLSSGKVQNKACNSQ
jgi:hypothetical protein